MNALRVELAFTALLLSCACTARAEDRVEVRAVGCAPDWLDVLALERVLEGEFEDAVTLELDMQGCDGEIHARLRIAGTWQDAEWDLREVDPVVRTRTLAFALSSLAPPPTLAPTQAQDPTVAQAQDSEVPPVLQLAVAKTEDEFRIALGPRILVTGGATFFGGAQLDFTTAFALLQPFFLRIGTAVYATSIQVTAGALSSEVIVGILELGGSARFDSLELSGGVALEVGGSFSRGTPRDASVSALSDAGLCATTWALFQLTYDLSEEFFLRADLGGGYAGSGFRVQAPGTAIEHAGLLATATIFAGLKFL
jgi:hypothetical protein